MKSPVITIKQGQLKGKLLTNHFGEEFYSFQGIPYAKAPVGNLRFAAPEPAEPWSEIYDATLEGPESPAPHIVLPRHVGREDNCLNLNIFTKHLPNEANDLYPVMVYIHGGGFVRGSNKIELYGPQFLMTENIVLVTINYRLGPLGFLCLEDESLNVPGNAGLKDQIMALKWIRDNIKEFCGDANNVTVFGESAGGASVHYLMLSPLAKGLFHKAIMQSASALNPWAEGTRGAEELCKKLGCKATDETEILKYLRQQPCKRFTEALLKSRDALRSGERRFYGPVVEKPSPGAVITDTPRNIIKSGNYNKVPLIVGNTNNEGLIFEFVRRMPPYAEYPLTDEEILKEIDYHYSLPEDENKRIEICNKIRKFYFGSEDASLDDIHKTIELKSDNMFIYGIQDTIRLHLKTSKTPIYHYVMSVDTELNVCKKIYTAHWVKLYGFLTVMSTKLEGGYIKSFLDILRGQLTHSANDYKGAAHGDDVLYLFKCHLYGTIAKNTPEEIGMRRFVKLWTNFATYGNPTPDSTDDLINVVWKPTDEDVTYLDIGRELEMKKYPNKEHIDLWDNIFKELNNAP